MKILMIGPHYGHNIEPFIDFFNEFELENCEVCFYSILKSKFKSLDRKKVKFYWGISIFILLFKQFDYIWNQGGYQWLINFVSITFRRKQTKYILNIWSERIIHKYKGKGINSCITQKLFREADLIFCNWHGTYKLLPDALKVKSKVFPWGLTKEYFNVNLERKTSNRKLTFFYPKSLNHSAGHILIIEACNKLVNDRITKFVVRFKIGNDNDLKVTQRIKDEINKYKLSDVIKFEDGGYKHLEEYLKIYDEIDVGLQIAKNDQLSTTFLEPMFFKKDIIATNIEPYRIFEEKYNLNIDLIEFDSNELYLQMRRMITEKSLASDLIKQKRSELIGREFNFVSNVAQIISYLHENKGSRK